MNINLFKHSKIGYGYITLNECVFKGYSLLDFILMVTLFSHRELERLYMIQFRKHTEQ